MVRSPQYVSLNGPLLCDRAQLFGETQCTHSDSWRHKFPMAPNLWCKFIQLSFKYIPSLRYFSFPLAPLMLPSRDGLIYVRHEVPWWEFGVSLYHKIIDYKLRVQM